MFHFKLISMFCFRKPKIIALVQGLTNKDFKGPWQMLFASIDYYILL